MSEDRVAREVRALVDQFPAPRPGFRDRVLGGVPDDRGLPRRRYWAAVGAAVLALALVATLVYGARGLVRHDRRPVTASPTAKPTPTATPPLIVNGLLKVPESTPVVAFVGPDDLSQVSAVTWDGHGPGMLGIRQQPPDGTIGAQSPDGSRFQLLGTAVNRDGQVQGSLATAGKPPVVWGDDSRHLCQMATRSSLFEGPTTLQLIQPGQPPRDVAQVGTAFAQSAPSVLACSMLGDRAVVVETGPIGNALELWVLRLSTGDILYHKTFPTTGGAATRVTASRDGQLLAETSTTCCPETYSAATIRRASDGTRLAGIDGAGAVWFSWSGDLAITTTRPGGVPRVIRWATGQVVWSGPAGSSYRGFLSEPNGKRLAIATGSESDPTAQASDIWIVSPDDGRPTPRVRGIWLGYGTR